MKKIPSPQAGFAWRCVWLSLVMLALVAVLSSLKLGGGQEPSGVVRSLASVFMLASWMLIIRFLMLKTWGRIAWLMILGMALIATQLWGKGGLILAIVMAQMFLFSRPLQAWRLVTARRRAIGFGLGILALVVLFMSTGVWSTEADDRILTIVDKLGIWSLASLLSFWFLSLFHLAVRMRLHFLRLRAKLAVSAFLIGFVPLALVLLLGLMIFYEGLGGSRSVRAGNILESWREMAAAGTDLAGAPFDTTFTWPDESITWPDTSFHPVNAPLWTPRLSKMLQAIPEVVSRQDTAGWFLMEEDIWLMRWNNVGQEDEQVRAWLLNDRPLLYLSTMLKTGVEITGLEGMALGAGIQFGSDTGDETPDYTPRKLCYREVSNDPTFWSRWRSFGLSLFAIHREYDGELDKGNLFINLSVGWPDLKTEFLDGENNLNLVSVIVLALVAFLFLTIEVFAFFFGVRISEGFVTAVHALRKGTSSLTQGELDTYIDIPNEDEFGDLADGFNEMTVAIRQGRDDALAKERLTREMETARGIQNRLLPSEEPALAGFEVTGASIPSREVGGDYFDFLMQDTDRIGVAIGDVSGKGMPAALLMSNLQASLHGQVIHPSSVAQVVGLVNDLIVASTDSHMFATFFYGLLDTTAGTFTSTNAGHNPPLVLRADGSIELLQEGGLLLGMLDGQSYKQETVNLGPGDVVVLYTDGITEAVGPAADEDDFDAMFGEEALEDVVRRSSHLPAAGIKEAILDAVSRHTEGVAQSDDITLVVIRRQG